MKQKLWSKQEPSCSYCEFGRLSPDCDMILCEKKGLRAPSSHCRSFRYDPFKRRPPADAIPQTADLRAEDFSLDID